MSANKQIYFNDGEAIEHADFNKMVQYIEKMYNDNQWFGRCALIYSTYAGNETAFFSGGSHAPFAAKAYVTNQAMQPWLSGSLNQTFNRLPGTVILPVGSDDPIGLADNLRTMQSFQMAGNSGSLLTPASSPHQWVLVYLDAIPSETYTDPQLRDFKDSVTGALSSQSLNKQKTQVPAITALTGTAGGGIPTLPAGAIPLYAYKLYDTPAGGTDTYVNPSELIDYTMPVNGLVKVNNSTTFTQNDAATWDFPVPNVGNLSWAAVRTGSNTDELFMAPAPFVGSNFARFLAVEIEYEATTTADVRLVRQTLNDVTSTTALISLSSISSGAGRLSLRGAALADPLWANGYAAGKALDYSSSTFTSTIRYLSTLALGITPTGTGDITIKKVTWSFAV